MTTPLDYEKFMPRGYTLVRTKDWVLTDPAVGTNISIGVAGPVDIYVTWEGETSIALVLITADGSRRTLETGAHAIRYTLGAKDGDMLTITGASDPFPASDSNLRGTLKILPTAMLKL
ncbi:hypothetical protein NQ028_13425 [Corynebacterium phoceense]|uniref:hypothetical protein n=1 Tax=Corynebacterium phoceense TaxID=1686286 RepID=UPI00211D009B|nr:hypothetical protein [Corynebacterium phoceense]MCQ9342115.1 hypothetical protein [Corynebacterium phoceense]